MARIYQQRWAADWRTPVWLVGPSIHAAAPQMIPFIKKGAAQWNTIGSTVQLQYGGLAPTDDYFCAPGPETSLVRMRNFGYADRDKAAWVKLCPDTGPPRKFLMEFNSATPFYSGTLDPPVGAWDVWAVSSHEFGHATGWVLHYEEIAPDAAQLCDEGNQRKHTMCTGVADSNQRMRTLEDHDVNTFWNAYPRPDVDPVCLRCPIGSS